MEIRDALERTIAEVVQEGKGILAADESAPTIAKRFKAIGVTSTEETRRQYRSLILSTEGLGEFISGVILFEETLGQHGDDGTLLPALAAARGIVPGIKVDKGKIPWPTPPVTRSPRAWTVSLSAWKGTSNRGPGSPSGGMCTISATTIRAAWQSRPTRRYWPATRPSASPSE